MKARSVRIGFVTMLVLAGYGAGAALPASDNEPGSRTRPSTTAPPSPMVCAAMEGDVSAIHKLAAGGADVNGTRTDWMTPLMWASATGGDAAARTLLDLGADPDARNEVGITALWQAARTGRLAIVRKLAARHVDLDAKVLDRLGGDTPLMCAADFGRADVAKFLVLHGADASARNSKGLTAAQIAESSGYADLAKWLQSHSRATTWPNSSRGPVPVRG